MVGIGFLAQKVCNLAAHFGDAFEDVDVAVFTFDVASGVELVELLADGVVVSIFHHGHIGGLVEAEEIFAVAAFGFGVLGCGVDYALGKSGELVFLKPDFVGVEFLEDVLAEAGGKFGEFGAEFFEFLAVGAFECRSGECESVVGLLEEHRVLGVEVEFGSIVVDLSDAVPEFGVENLGC